MKKTLYILLNIAIMISLSGCGSNTITSQNLTEKLIEHGVPESSIKENEKKLYTQLYIHDKDLGYANIYIFSNVKDAKEFWDELDDRYDNLEYLDKTTAVGDLKDVCDASIEEWVYWTNNVYVSVEQYVANEWATYIAEDGEEYYGDGTKVSDVPTPSDQRAKAETLEQIILSCLSSV